MGPSTVHIQVCGRLAVVVDGRRVERGLPGRQGRILLAFMAVHRARALSRDELLDAVWPHEPPRSPHAALRALLSKLRAALGDDLVAGRDAPRLVLPPGGFVDFESALDALHRAESAVARDAPVAGWAPARVALHTADRGFLPGEDAPWIDDARRRLDDVRLRALEAVAAIGVAMGGGELAAAERSGRRLVALAPLRETGWAWLMRAHAARGNPAEALAAYERLRVLLREDLGTVPSAPVQALHAALLDSRQRPG